MNFKLSVTGWQQVDKVLAMMPKELTHKVLGAAHADAARPTVDREHLLAPVRNTGNLAESIGIEKANFKSTREIGLVKVGPRKGGRYKGFAAHLVEYGTRQRRTRGRGRRIKTIANRGIMPVKKFAYPAFQQTQRQVEGRIANSLTKILLRTMKRYIKR